MNFFLLERAEDNRGLYPIQTIGTVRLSLQVALRVFVLDKPFHGLVKQNGIRERGGLMILNFLVKARQ